MGSNDTSSSNKTSPNVSKLKLLSSKFSFSKHTLQNKPVRSNLSSSLRKQQSVHKASNISTSSSLNSLSLSNTNTNTNTNTNGNTYTNSTLNSKPKPNSIKSPKSSPLEKPTLHVVTNKIRLDSNDTITLPSPMISIIEGDSQSKTKSSISSSNSNSNTSSKSDSKNDQYSNSNSNLSSKCDSKNDQYSNSKSILATPSTLLSNTFKVNDSPLIPDYNPIIDALDSDSDSDSDNESTIEKEKKLKREEDLKDYCPGGYHPTFIGERYGTENQYLINRKLGWGHFSTVWLAWDSKNSRHVAIKIVRSSANYKEAALDEIKILEKVMSTDDDHPGKKHVVQLFDHFIHKGPNGDHVCMVFEVLGENMLSLTVRYKEFQKFKTKQLEKSNKISATNSVNNSNENLINNAISNSDSDFDDDDNQNISDSLELHLSNLNDLTILKESYGGLPITLVRQISKQILFALDYLHNECGIIHTDLKPENVLVEIHDVEKLVQLLELERKNKKMIKLMEKRQNEHSTFRFANECLNKPKQPSLSRKHSIPIRASRPLTSPIENNSSVDNFFRSFSFSQKRTPSFSSSSFHNSSGINLESSLGKSVDRNNSFANNKLSTTPSQLRYNVQKDEKQLLVDVIDEDDNEDDEEFVDARDIISSPAPPPQPPLLTPQPPLLTPQSTNNSTFNMNSVPFPTPKSNPPDLIPGLGLGNSTSKSNNGHSRSQSTTSGQNSSRRESNFSSASYQSILNEFDSIITVKIADLGNACWYNKHYTSDIQTRQYRAPEVILGGDWGCSTDLWSFACLIFELLTGDYLFDPKSSNSYSKNDDHLAQIVELLQDWPSKDYLRKCKYSREFFDKSLQNFKNIGKLKIWTMFDVLKEEYMIDEKSAKLVSNFLLSMLEFEPRRRIDAGSMSNHPWIVDVLSDENLDRKFGLRGQDIKGYTSEFHDDKREYDE